MGQARVRITWKPTKKGKVICLCPTRGRFTLLRKSVSMFLLQDYGDKELWILNNHKEPISSGDKLPSSIKIINTGPVEDMAVLHNKILRQVDSEFVCIWEDDDIYLPWHLSNIIKYFEEDVDATKPLVSIALTSEEGKVVAVINDNHYEAAHIVRTSHLRKFGFGRFSSEDAEWCWHWKWIRNISNMVRPSIEDSSYVYVWGRGAIDKLACYHTSGGNIEIFRENSDDSGGGNPLEPLEGTSLFDAVESIKDIPSCELEIEPFLNRLYSYNDGVLYKKVL